MENQKRPFTQYDDNISATQEDNGSNGADDRPVPDNGTKSAHFSAGGMPTVTKVDYALPPDPHAPPGPSDIASTPHNPESPDEIADYGLNERVSVGFNGGIHEYGLVSGETKQEGMDDSISGQGFGSGKSSGSSDTKE